MTRRLDDERPAAPRTPARVPVPGSFRTQGAGDRGSEGAQAISDPSDAARPTGSEDVAAGPRRTRSPGVGVAVVAMIVALAIAALIGFETWLRTGGDAPEPADAVVVLGPGRDGERLERGLALVGEDLADTLVVSMGRGAQRAKTEALCSREPTGFELVCFTATPFSTRGEAQIVAQLAAARAWDTLLLVTSDYHVRRTRLLFSRCYDGRLVVAEATSRTGPAVVLTDAHEAAGLLYSIFVGRDC